MTDNISTAGYLWFSLQDGDLVMHVKDAYLKHLHAQIVRQPLILVDPELIEFDGIEYDHKEESSG